LIYVILGMHKSGTTLLAQMLHHSQINMGDFAPDVGYDQGNQYERQSTLNLNLSLLQHQSLYGIIFQKTPKLQPTTEQLVRIQTLIERYNREFKHWGFKDPRTCLTYSIWSQHLPNHKIIVVYRHPQEIWPRFRYNSWRLSYTNPERAWRFINSWYEYNTYILKALQTTPHPFIVLNYQALMNTQTEFDRLQHFVEMPLSDQRKKEMYRNKTTSHSLLNLILYLNRITTKQNYQKIINQFKVLQKQQLK